MAFNALPQLPEVFGTGPHHFSAQSTSGRVSLLSPDKALTENIAITYIHF
jgi:hypothetical protein